MARELPAGRGGNRAELCWTCTRGRGWGHPPRAVSCPAGRWHSGSLRSPSRCLLQTWQSTILVVSHDRNFLNTVATDIIHLHSQRLDTYRGDFENFMKTKEERLKNQQREYEAQQQYREHIQVLRAGTLLPALPLSPCP